VRLLWDMESGDPDDFITLLLLLGHPSVDLRGVTVTPGGADQIGLVRWALDAFGRDDIRLGAFHDPAKLERMDKRDHGKVKNRVSRWHYKVYGEIPSSYEAEPGVDILREEFTPETTLVTGGPLKNLGALLREEGDAALGRLFVQGGFAGDNIVPAERRLAKFDGKITCPTYNLNGDPKSALLVAASTRFSDKRFVSKNVCHGVSYTQSFHERVQAAKTEASGRWLTALELIDQGMSHYLQKHPDGKKLHDPLAACCALDPDIGQWEHVELYREKGQWGARLSPGSHTQIIVDYDHERFVQVFTGSV